MDFMFSKCSSLKELDISNFNTTKVKYMISIFDSCWLLDKQYYKHIYLNKNKNALY